MKLLKIICSNISSKLLGLIACFFSCVPAFTQNINIIKPLTQASLSAGNFYKLGSIKTHSNTYIINYDSADAEVWGSNYIHSQMSLMNVHYLNSLDSSAANSSVINYVSVAFDSLIDPYRMKSYPADSVSGISVDTIIIPLVQVNHSKLNDTLEVQLNSVNNFGYPTNSVLLDKMIINTQIGDTNSKNIVSLIKVPMNYPVSSSTKFAVTLKYYGSKKDSCWFIYGYGSFLGSCYGGGVYTLAEPSSFSKIDMVNGSFTANSFILYNKYKSTGYYPTNSGNVLYYDCNGDSVFTPGIDGDNYIQNINIYAMVTSLPLGINELNKNDFKVDQNYPNPFSFETQINYSLAKASDVVLTISDLMGRELISKVFNGVSPGDHTIKLGAESLVSGIYFYSMKIGGSSVIRKMTVIK